MDRIKNIFNNHLDIVGLFGSALCVVHCSALPLLLGMGMLSGMEWMDSHWVEYIFLLSAFAIAGFTIVRSYMKHKRSLALIIALIGFTIFLIGFAQHNHNEIGLTTLGGICIAIAHIINWRVIHSKEIKQVNLA